MSLGWVIFGTLFQVVFAGIVLMLTIFAGAGLDNSGSLNRFQTVILGLSTYVLPALCLISAWMVIQNYRIGGDVQAFWWYAMPVVSTIVYILYVAILDRN